MTTPLTSTDDLALVVNDEALSLGDLLRPAKLNGQLQFLENAIDAALIRQGAAAHGLEATADELQQAADDFRAERELYSLEATENWLRLRNLSFADWEMLLEEQCLARRLRETLTAARIEKFFAENRFTFEAAILARLVVEDEDLARELRAQIVEDGADFHALARRYSTDDATRPMGGYAGALARTEMEAAMEAAIYRAAAGDIVGPLKTEEGWTLVKVEGFKRAQLDDPTREAIKTTLFDEWLDERRGKARLRIPLLELLPEDE